MIAFTLLGTNPLAAQGNKPLEEVDTSLANAYQAIQNEDSAGAESGFSQAAKQAQKIQDWQGLTDAAYGIAALGKPDQALALFQQAFQIARDKKSWQGLIAAGYGISSLPKEVAGLTQSNEAFIQAEQLASQNQDWRGLIESAKGFNVVGNQAKANRILNNTYTLAEETQDAEAAMALASAFQTMGNRAQSARAQDLANYLSRQDGGDVRGVKTPPPPGWSATGKSVRDAEDVPEQAQRLNRASVDKDIDNKMAYIKEQERLKAEKERNRTRLAEAYLYYSGYYGHPGRYFGINNFGLHGFGRHSLSRSHLRSFASFQLSRFSRRGGYFIRVNRGRYYY